MDLPQEFLARMRTMLGEEYDAFLRTYEEPRRFGLRVNTMKISVEEFVRLAPFHLTPIPWISNGFYYEREDDPARHPFYYAGLYYLQEPSAMTPASVLPVRPGERVLDLCAAPGGKATALAAKLRGEGLLVANDISASRAKALLKNLEVFGVKNSFVTNAAPARLAEQFPEAFDKILVDAPCSGEGMFRKDIANAKVWSPEKVAACARTQRDITVRAAGMLRPGGLMLYSTCTFSAEENEGTIAYLLEQCPELELIDLPQYEGFEPGRPELLRQPEIQYADFEPENAKPLECSEKQCEDYRSGYPEIFGLSEARYESLRKCVRIFPHKMGGEGHFLALLHKKEMVGTRPGIAVFDLEPKSLRGIGEARGDQKETLGKSSVPAREADYPTRNASARKSVRSSRGISAGNAARSTCDTPAQQPVHLSCTISARNAARGACGTLPRKSNRPSRSTPAQKSGRPARDDEQVLREFMQDVTMDWHMDQIEVRAGQAYFIPEPPQISGGIPFLRNGLYLGELKKGRFEPSQSFAMALRAGEYRNTVSLSQNDDRVRRYLSGETIELTDDELQTAANGWRLVCVDGYSLGWGKLVNGTLKNKYHPGWRMISNG